MIETPHKSGNLQKSSGIFGNFQKVFDNVRVTFGQVLENLWKSLLNKQSFKGKYASFKNIKARQTIRLSHEQSFVFTVHHSIFFCTPVQKSYGIIFNFFG